MKYGPYDNGHIVIGTSAGQILIFDALSLNIIFRFDKIVASSIQ